jgi:hypothetical protein
MWKIINDTIAFLANWFEVIGFIIGIFVAIKVYFINREIKSLNKRHLYHQRIDEHLTELKTYSRNLADLIPNYKDNIKDIRLVAATCRVNCLSLRKKVEKRELQNLTSVINSSKNITSNKLDISKEPNFLQTFLKLIPISENQLDNYYEALASLISEIEHLNQDIKKTLK